MHKLINVVNLVAFKPFPLEEILEIIKKYNGDYVALRLHDVITENSSHRVEGTKDLRHDAKSVRYVSQKIDGADERRSNNPKDIRRRFGVDYSYLWCNDCKKYLRKRAWVYDWVENEVKLIKYVE